MKPLPCARADFVGSSRAHPHERGRWWTSSSPRRGSDLCRAHDTKARHDAGPVSGASSARSRRPLHPAKFRQSATHRALGLLLCAGQRRRPGSPRIGVVTSTWRTPTGSLILSVLCGRDGAGATCSFPHRTSARQGFRSTEFLHDSRIRRSASLNRPAGPHPEFGGAYYRTSTAKTRSMNRNIGFTTVIGFRWENIRTALRCAFRRPARRVLRHSAILEA